MQLTSDIGKRIEWADTEEDAFNILTDAIEIGYQIDQPSYAFSDDRNVGYGNWPLLHICVDKNFLDLASFLLRSGVNVNEKNLWGMTALHRAAYHDNEQMVKLLLDNDAKLLQTDKEGETPLHIASSHGHDAVCRTLLLANSNLNVSDCNGITPLYAAASTNRVEILKMLLHYGADPDKSSPEGVTPVHIAASLGHQDCVACLVKSGADLNFRSIDGVNPLLAAVLGGHAHVVKILLSSLNLNLNVRDNLGRTALYLAVSQSKYDITLMLLQADANPQISAHDRTTPLYSSWRNKDNDIQNLLRDHNATIGTPTALFAALAALLIIIIFPFFVGLFTVGLALLMLPLAIYLMLSKFEISRIMKMQPMQKRRSSESAIVWELKPVMENLSVPTEIELI